MAQAIASASRTENSHTTAATDLKSTIGRSITGVILDPLRSLLLLRFTLLNIVAFSLLGVAWSQGYVSMVLAADKTYLSVVIFAVFLVGLAIATCKVWQTNREIDAINSPKGIHSTSISHLISSGKGSSHETPSISLSSSMRMQVAHRISVVRHLANTLVLLGLIGTVLGFIIALSGVNPDTVADINAIAPMVSTLISGMSTALYTTLIGSILNVWLMANYQILAGGTVSLISALEKAVERNA